MVYHEEHMDLFKVPEDYYLAHCISADFGMGKGIVVEFNKRFNTKNNLMSRFPDYLNTFRSFGTHEHGDCILDGRILNLITKMNYWQKPTNRSMFNALVHMREVCLRCGITKIAMPTIGCGLDGLKWNEVRELITSVFNDTQIEIMVCIK